MRNPFTTLWRAIFRRRQTPTAVSKLPASSLSPVVAPSSVAAERDALRDQLARLTKIIRSRGLHALAGQPVADHVPLSNEDFVALLDSRPVDPIWFWEALVEHVAWEGCTANQRQLIVDVLKRVAGEKS